MRLMLVFFIPLFLSAKSSFITPMEYSSSLYENPRGIGCHHCHGKKGQGKIVANYIHKKKKKSFMGPKINSINYDEFERALMSSKKGMPRYYLTIKEIKALFFYLQEMKVDDEN